MVARTPPKQRKVVVAPINPVLLRETLKKVDRCMARLQELQYTVAGGTKVISGVSLSPRSTRGYLRTSLRCKQESLRIKNTGSKKSPVGKLPATTAGEWRRMSLPAMLVDETVGEILQATQFAREIVAAMASKTKNPSSIDDPKTPVTERRKQRHNPENSELKARRHREKLTILQSIRSECVSPSLHRARSRINFKVSPPKKKEFEKENPIFSANRVSPKNRPWSKKTVLFPNPLFLSTSSTQKHKFCKTRSPVIGRKRESPHKFLIKSPPSPPSSAAAPLKFRVKIKSPPVVSLSPTRLRTSLRKKSPPEKLSTVSKLRRSFSPSRLASRLVSPLKSRKSLVQKSDAVAMRGLKQRPAPMSMTMSFPTGRI